MMRRHNLNIVCAVLNGMRSYPTASASRWPTAIKCQGRTYQQYQHQRFYSQANNTHCWNCNEPLSSEMRIQFVCLKCQCLVQIPQRVDYFQVMGLDRKYTVDTTELTKRFRGIQSVLHPDKFSNKSDEEQTLSADWSSLINNAYKTLQSPIRRGEYLLELHGVTVPEGNSELNKEFLMEMMDRNEEVDDAETEKELSDLLHKVRTDQNRCVEKLEKSLNDNKLEEAKADLIILRYFVSLENSIKVKGNRSGFHL